MRKNKSFKKQLYLTYLLIGALNVIIIFFFNLYIHRTSSETLIQRAEEQMISVRSMTSAQLVLYFQKLKLKLLDLSEELAENDHEISQYDQSIIALWKVGSKTEQLLGTSAKVPPHEKLKVNSFYHHKENFILKTEEDKKIFVWLINSTGISDLFDEREGLGTTGEIYLIGKDLKIKSALRHLKDWHLLKVKNVSVDEAFKRSQGVNVVEDYRKVKVVSAYSNFQFDELEFALLSEIDLEEVLRPLNRLLYTIFGLSALLLIINLVFSSKLTARILKVVTSKNQVIQNLHAERERSDHENALKIFRVQENERERISFSLHDSVGQYLTVLKWGLSKLKAQETNQERQKDIDQLSETCNDIIQDIRDISHDLMPTLIRDFGVCSAVKDYLEKQNLKGALKVTFLYPDDLVDVKFKKDFEVNLYRMIQELYQNNIKHANATKMEIELSQNDGNNFTLRYTDNGDGMPQDAELPYSISYRAKLFGGKLERLDYDRGLMLLVTFNMGLIRE